LKTPLPRRQFLAVSLTASAIDWTLAEAPGIPQNLDQLWADYEGMDRSTPLALETLKEWEQDGVTCRLVRYQVGIFKGSPSRVAAFFAFPKGGSRLPAIIDLHGGGQSASLGAATTWARRGYACLSLNWGGNPLNFGGAAMTYEGPQTDWGRLDATHPPQRNRANHFAGPMTPDEFTLDAVESPRNSNWYLVLMAARRAISLIQQQPEVDPGRIGARGHSMGGKLTTNLAGIDRRIRAAAPSCGGSGDLLESQTDIPGGRRKDLSPLELHCVSDNAYIPRIACPVLWLSPTNDFHAHIDNMAWNWRTIPDAQLRLSIAPHLNHRHTPEHALTEYLWFEENLKGAGFRVPKTPEIVLDLTGADGGPVVTVTPDASRPVARVDIYYSIDPHGLTRFWRDAGAVKDGDRWRAGCPVMSLDDPIFAFANVIYDTPAEYRTVAQAPGQEDSGQFAISSRVLSAGPDQLRAAKVRATDSPDRLIDDGARGWHDWYRLNWGHPPLWSATTRKLKDPKWRGPDGATLHFEIQSETDNQLVLTFQCNAWGAFEPGKPAVDYTAVKPVKGAPGWQPVSVALGELFATDPKITEPLANWRTVAEFSISPKGEVVRDGRKVSVSGKPWQGSRAIRHLRWEGGTHAPSAGTGKGLNEGDFGKNFDNAIKKSLEQEKLDRK
jgi:dienelactone hydrolase